jgi:hypothetical protein
MALTDQDILLTARELVSNALPSGFVDKYLDELTAYLAARSDEWASEDPEDFRYQQIIDQFFSS